MNVTLTVHGTLEDDPALQEMLSILCRKDVPKKAAEIHEPTVTVGAEPFGELLVAPGAGPGKPERLAGRKPAVDEPQFEAAVVEMAAEPKQEPRAAVDFATVAKAASEAINSGKREGFANLLKGHGAQTLAEIPKEDYPAVLAEIGAL